MEIHRTHCSTQTAGHPGFRTLQGVLGRSGSSWLWFGLETVCKSSCGWNWRFFILVLILSTTCTMLGFIRLVSYSLCNNDWLFIQAQALLSYSISHRHSNISIKAIKLNVVTLVVTCMQYWWWKTSQYFTRQQVMSFWMIHLFFCFISLYLGKDLPADPFRLKWSFGCSETFCNPAATLRLSKAQEPKILTFRNVSLEIVRNGNYETRLHCKSYA